MWQTKCEYVNISYELLWGAISGSPFTWSKKKRLNILLKFFFCVYYKDAIDNGVTWQGINDDRIVIFERTVSLRMLKIELVLRVQ